MRSENVLSPPAPIPPPLRANEAGTFTHSSVVERLPDIGRRTIAENDFPSAAVRRLEALVESIPGGPLRAIDDPGAPDEGDWAGYVKPYLGMDWLDAPWFFAENYFYRRLLEATGYFQRGPGERLDPFRVQKRRALEAARRHLARPTRGGASDGRAIVGARFLASLWGNKADLSLWPVEGEGEGEGAEPAEARVLANDLPQVLERLFRGSGAERVDLLADNAGLEILADLKLADTLLQLQLAGRVVFHLKSHPTFVSDATAPDALEAITALDPATGLRLRSHLEKHRLLFESHGFWTSPLSGWEMPAPLRASLSRSALVIAKGDAHYRRLLGDRHWRFTMPFDEILRYLPAPLVALRTLKSEVAAGLERSAIERASRAEPQWMTDGDWGVIQFAGGAGGIEPTGE